LDCAEVCDFKKYETTNVLANILANTEQLCQS
jgi:hypothetical protein